MVCGHCLSAIELLVAISSYCAFEMIPPLYFFALVLWLQMRRNMAKLELYRKFTNALAVSVLLSIAWIGFEVIFIFLFWVLN